MIADIGHFALVSALLASLLQALAPVKTPQISWAAFGLCLLSFTCLMISHATSDFSVANVYQNSHSVKPMLYKITGTWGNHEGSMLLWALILTAYGAAYGLMNRTGEKLPTITLRVQGGLALGFFCFILFTSNPFVQIHPVPIDGLGLNPLLQDIGLAIHPPVLYLGYVGFSLVFSMAVAALLLKETSRNFFSALRPWALFSWSMLTLGIGLGSWWAYRELGWGGFWFWDPVENASLLPWLAATALIHSLLITIKRELLAGWTLFLALLTFSLSLLGTFLVRSGVLTSVHAFANDPERGMFILAFLIAVFGGSIVLFTLRQPLLAKKQPDFVLFSKEGAILVNNILWLCLCGTVLLGTVYPLLLEVVAQQSVSVGAPYFNAMLLPFAAPLLMLAAIAPAFAWCSEKKQILYRYLLPLIVSIGFVIALHFTITAITFKGWIAFIVSIFLALSMLQSIWQKRKQLKQQTFAFWGMFTAHIGIAILAIGVTAHSEWALEQQHVMKQGDVVTLGNYQTTFNEMQFGNGQNYFYRRGDLAISKNERAITNLTPESRFYPVENQQTLESSILTTPFYDIYAAMGEVNAESQQVGIRLYYRPLISWIWAGCLLMTLGGILAIYRNKKRK